MPQFGPLGASQILAVSQTSARVALGTLPSANPAVLLTGLNAQQDVWYVRFGDSSVTAGVNDLKVRPGSPDEPAILPVPEGSTHIAIICEGANGDVVVTAGEHINGGFSGTSSGGSEISVTQSSQAFALPSLGTNAPAIALISRQAAMGPIWVKLGTSGVTVSQTDGMRITPGSAENPTIIRVTNSETHIAILCEGEPGPVMLSGGQMTEDIRLGYLNWVRAKQISSTDLDDLLVPGFYDGHTLTNSPNGTTDWFYTLVQRHSNNALYVSQTAWSLTSNGRAYVRNRVNGTWGVWRRLANPQQSTLAGGDIIYYDGADFVRLAAGTTGQLLQTNGAGNAPSWVDPRPTVTADQATTSGTSFDFTGLPADVSRISINLNGVSLSGTDNLLVQIGDSGGIENTGYVSITDHLSGGASTSTAGFVVGAGAAAEANGGIVELRKISATAWVATHVMNQGLINTAVGVGRKTLSAGPLDRIRLLAVGANTFDSGSVNIIYD